MAETVPLQRTFDLVARHLRRQGRPSLREARGPGFTPGYGGAYRGAAGCKCAAGCLIPDGLYSPEMEGRGVCADQPAGIAVASLGHDLGLVLQLQLLHDGLIDTWSPIGVVTGLQQLAASFGLNPHAATGPL